MVNHGISTGALFLIVGFIYERRHTRELDEFGGLWAVTPLYAVLTLIVALSSMGLPGLNGFVGEFSILLGAWGAGQAGGSLGSILYAAFAAVGVILAAVYILYMFQKMFLGPITVKANEVLKDLSWRELAVIIPLVILIFWIGIYPKPFFDLIHPAVEQLLSVFQNTGLALH
jgi:NADH-quinone oxidoreductase subunit M